MTRIVGHRILRVEVFAIAESMAEARALELALKAVPSPEAYAAVLGDTDFSPTYRANLAEYAGSGTPLTDPESIAAHLAQVRLEREAAERNPIPAPPLTTEQEARLAATDPPEPIDVLNVEKGREHAP